METVICIKRFRDGDYYHSHSTEFEDDCLKLMKENNIYEEYYLFEGFQWDVYHYGLAILRTASPLEIASEIEAMIDRNNGDYCLVEKGTNGYSIDWISEGSPEYAEYYEQRYGEPLAVEND